MKQRRLIIALLLLLPPGGWLGFRVWQWSVVPSAGPIVGVSSDTAWHSRLGLSNTTYQVALARAKARVHEFRPGDAAPEELLDRIDALLLAGGGDVNPTLYGGELSASQFVDSERDEFELELIQGAIDRKMPILGICRGLQILNVAHGGSLKNIRADPTLGPEHGGEMSNNHMHDVEIKRGSRLARIEAPGNKRVNSYHGQAIARLGAGLQAVAQADGELIEAIERPGESFLVGVQWHPEILSLQSPAEMKLLKELTRQARRYRKARPRKPAGIQQQQP